MVQTSKPWVRHDPTGSRGGSSASRCLLRKAKMRAVFVVVADVFREQPFQMPFLGEIVHEEKTNFAIYRAHIK